MFAKLAQVRALSSSRLQAKGIHLAGAASLSALSDAVLPTASVGDATAATLALVHQGEPISGVPSTSPFWSGFSGEAKTAAAYFEGGQCVVGAGLGAKSTLSARVVREAAAAGVECINKLKCKDPVTVRIPDTIPEALLPMVVSGCLCGNHRFDRYLTKAPHRTTHFRFSPALEPLLATGRAYAAGTLLARELVNDRADVVTPDHLEEIAVALAKAHGLTLHCVSGPELTSTYPLLSAVGQGARYAPRLVSLQYKAKKPSGKKPVVLIGKGITFDTGGLNLKPTKFIEDMHMDMGGAAAVLGAMKSVALLEPDVDVHCVLAVAENAVGSKAYKPHAIIETEKGSVEVANTDAEGRLAMADAFLYAQKQYKETPLTMIDAATLTGACVVALGEEQGGLFTNDDDLAARLLHHGECTAEPLWRLPIAQEHRDALKGDLCDFRSDGSSRYGGASAAAAFLEKFVEPTTSWAHLDIAGPGMLGKGFGSHLLSHFIVNE